MRTNSLKAILKPLPKIKGKALTKYENSFAIQGAKLWNVLPYKLSKVKDLNRFKDEPDKFLNDIPDEPPLPNYPYRNNNSLVDHCRCSA